MTVVEQADALWRDPRRARNLWWTEHVSYRLGSLVAAVLLRTQVSPNAITLVGLALHVLGAVAVLLFPGVADPLAAVAVAVVWQAAYALDCADGQLARARQSSNPYGAWLDQVVDQVAHAIVFTALAAYLAREAGLSSVASMLLVGYLVGGQAVHGVAAGLKPLLLGRRGTVSDGRRGTSWYQLLHLADYGLLLAISALTLPVPHLAVTVVVLSTTLSLLAVAAQLAQEWRRSRATPTD